MDAFQAPLKRLPVAAGFRTRSAGARLAGRRLPQKWIAFLLAIGLTCVGFAFATTLVIASLGLINPRPAQVDVYTDLLNQPLETITGLGASCPLLEPDYQEYVIDCFYLPADGPIARIAVRVSNGKAGQIILTVRDNRLTLGELVALWGRPEITPMKQSSHLEWLGRGISAETAIAGLPVSYFAVIERVTLTSGSPAGNHPGRPIPP